jgi:hypothetical protein
MPQTLCFYLKISVYFEMLTFLGHVLFILNIQNVPKLKDKTPVPKGYKTPYLFNDKLNTFFVSIIILYYSNENTLCAMKHLNCYLSVTYNK